MTCPGLHLRTIILAAESVEKDKTRLSYQEEVVLWQEMVGTQHGRGTEDRAKGQGVRAGPQVSVSSSPLKGIATC